MRRIYVAAAASLLFSSIVASAVLRPADAAAVQPNRVLDTRIGVGAPKQPLVPGVTVAMPLTAAIAAGATAVTLNLTASEATAPGYLTVWPCGQAAPTTSIVNFTPGRVSANFVAVGVGAAGVCVASSAPVHVIADLMGTFSSPLDFKGAAPTRVLDTRTARTRLRAGEERHVSLTSGAGYDSSAHAAALNITVVGPGADGYVEVYPCGPRPVASTVTYHAGEVVPSFTMVPISGGEVCLFALSATDVLVDSFGWSTNADGLRFAAPARLLDTRSGIGWTAGATTPSTPVTLRVAGRLGVPNDAAAALVTLTAVGGTADGFVTAWPCDQPRPTASVLNLRPGSVGSNLTYLPLSTVAGTVCFFASTVDGSPVDLVADAVGWAPGGPSRGAPPPETGGGTGHFGTLPVGSALPADAACAAQVRRGGNEVRPSNAAFNQTRGHTPPANSSYPLYSRVTGNFTGTTDEIIQWAACKWGYDEDVLRAQVAKESWWHMSALGDLATDPGVCAPGHPLGADGHPGQCPESVGLLQVRYQYFKTVFPDAENSSALNLDVSLAVWRTCFEGGEGWLNTVEQGQPYVAGDQWGCVGRWFSGRWHTAPSETYIQAVKDYLAQKVWTTSNFASDP